MKTSIAILVLALPLGVKLALPSFAATPAIAPAPATTALVACTTYCTAGTTTNSCNASMSCSGTPSLANASGFVIAASSVEGQKNGVIRYSLAPKMPATPWGNGGTSFVCIQAPSQNTGIQNSGGTAGLCDGALSLDWFAFTAAHPSALGQPQVVGSTFYLQAIFKDPPAVKTTSRSDALTFTIVS